MTFKRGFNVMEMPDHIARIDEVPSDSGHCELKLPNLFEMKSYRKGDGDIEVDQPLSSLHLIVCYNFTLHTL